MTTTTYTVEGMTCDHCVRSVTGAVQAVRNVERAEVDLASGTLTVAASEPIDDGAIRDAVREAGYEVAG